MITLALDASTYAGDVAAIDDGRVLAQATTTMKGANEERLMPAVARVLDDAGIPVSRIDRVVCGAGPGSFTSLRIAGAIAKGIAVGVGCALYAVPSMALIVGGAALEPGRYLVAVDALRGELYVGIYELCEVQAAESSERSSVVRELEPARLIDASALPDLVADTGARVVSPSASVPVAGAIVAPPRACAVARLEALLSARGPVDLQRWEPAYGRLAEAQVRWESAHGRPLPTG